MVTVKYGGGDGDANGGGVDARVCVRVCVLWLMGGRDGVGGGALEYSYTYHAKHLLVTPITSILR